MRLKHCKVVDVRLLAVLISTEVNIEAAWGNQRCLYMIGGILDLDL